MLVGPKTLDELIRNLRELAETHNIVVEHYNHTHRAAGMGPDKLSVKVLASRKQ